MKIRKLLCAFMVLLCITSACACSDTTPKEESSAMSDILSSESSETEISDMSDPTSEEPSQPEININELYEEAAKQSEGKECIASLGCAFSDGAVLQRDANVPVWGHAPSGERVFITFNGQLKSAVADGDGVWELYLDPMEANAAPNDLKLLCGGEKVINNILVGEVWIASGQSNMSFIIDYLLGSLPGELRNDCDYPEVRLYLQDESMSRTVTETTVNGRWEESNRGNIGHFSTLGFMLGRGLHKALGVPVGVIMVSYGGTRIESFIQAKRQYKCGGAVYGGVKQETAFNSMIAPITPYRVNGMIWYQGEGNVNPDSFVPVYSKYVGAYVTQMREEFVNPEMAFIQVQLPSFDDPTTDFTNMRFVQMSCDSLFENVFTVPSYDTGKADDIHPSDKGPIAERILAVALNKVYGMNTNFDFADAVLFETQGSALIVGFDCGGDFSVTLNDDGNLNGLFACGADGVYYPATAKAYSKNKIVITSAAVKTEIMGVKYACQNYMKPVGLYDENGYPVMPFAKTIE